MSTLKTFFKETIKAGEEISIEAPDNVSTVLTQCYVDNEGNPYKRAILRAHVETLPADLIEKDPDAPSIDSDVVLASFTPNGPQIQTLCIGFTKEDITYLQAEGASITISGYSVPPKTELFKVHEQNE